MLFSGFLLLVFLSWWMQSQYREARSRLHQDLELRFTAVEQALSDSLLNRQVGSLLQQRKDRDTALRFVFRKNDVATTTAPKARVVLLSNDASGSLQKVSQQDISYLQPGADVPINSAEKLKILRLTMQQIISDIDIDTFASTIDTSRLQAAFGHSVQQLVPGASVLRITGLDSSRLFAFGPDLSTRILSVKGYHWYLVREVLPQAIFCIVLLLLTGLAFLMAYRNTRQQTLFSEQKDHFISNISHELKTPVATTKVAIEALEHYDALDDPQRSRRYLRMASWEINRLESMINKIMDIAQMTNGALILEKAPVDLKELLREIMVPLEQVLIEKKIALDWVLPESACWVLADHTHLTGAVYNLLDNAIKYGQEQIRISINREEQNLCLCVADKGPGIPQAYQSRIFDKFVRLPQGDVHTVKGYGLGLSYALYVVEAHGGSLRLEKKAGWGAVFCISLPEYHDHEV